MRFHLGHMSVYDNFEPTNYNTERTTNYKTVLCYFFKNGYCGLGEHCSYAHGPSELREHTTHRALKTQMCKNIMEKGVCPYGDQCFFAHNEEELVVIKGSKHSSVTDQKAPAPVPAPGPCLDDMSMFPPIGGKACPAKDKNDNHRTMICLERLVHQTEPDMHDPSITDLVVMMDLLVQQDHPVQQTGSDMEEASDASSVVSYQETEYKWPEFERIPYEVKGTFVVDVVAKPCMPRTQSAPSLMY
jgi:hypothetical protein